MSNLDVWWDEGLAVTLKPVEMMQSRWWWWLPLVPDTLWRWLSPRKTFPAGTIVVVNGMRTNIPLLPGPFDAILQIKGHPWHPNLPRWYREGKTDEYRMLSPLEQLAHGAFDDVQEAQDRSAS